MGSFQQFLKPKMNTLTVTLLVAGVTFTQARPQGILNGISNLLTSAFGGGRSAGEVDDYENAPYEVIQTYNGYEERFYPSRFWVCTRSESNNGGFMKLFRYISGANARKQKIDMTVPMMMTHDEKGVEMCFYLTQSTQANAPQPTGEDVYLSQKKGMTVYATSVGGYPNHDTEAAKFRAVLERGRASQVDFSKYLAMGYDSPMKILNRRTDYMYLKF